MGKLRTRTAGSRLAIVLTTVIVTTVVIVGGVALANVDFNSVGTTQIINDSIQSVDIAEGAVRSSDITDNSVRGLDIKDGTITSADIAAGTVTDGEDGAPGAPGAPGEDGAPGADGAPGEDGAPGADGVSGYELVSEVVTLGADGSSADLVLSCPAGKTVLGGGQFSPDGFKRLDVWRNGPTGSDWLFTYTVEPGGNGRDVIFGITCATTSGGSETAVDATLFQPVPG